MNPLELDGSGADSQERGMWTTENRGRYDRSKLRYPSDLAGAERGLVAPLIPPAKRGGNKRTVDVREIVNGTMYILGTGCQWAALPTDLPPGSTVNSYFLRWQHDGALDRYTTRSTSNAGTRRDARPSDWLRSSTAKASRARKRRAFGPARL
jgi:transposase